jgi:hypothetical protein
MMGPGGKDSKLELITELCRDLAKLGLSVGMSDATPAVMIRTNQKPTLWVTVNDSAEFFQWGEPESQHPVSDPVGAAALISGHVKKAQRSGPGETP